MLDFITYEDSIKFGCDLLSYSEYVSDEQIEYFLSNNEKITPDHYMIINSTDVHETINHLERILHQINELKLGKILITFEVWYNNESDFPDYPDIYDGWHRIRAYQFMEYKQIPCIIIKTY
jgi:hypothetical protein